MNWPKEASGKAHYESAFPVELYPGNAGVIGFAFLLKTLQRKPVDHLTSQ